MLLRSRRPHFRPTQLPDTADGAPAARGTTRDQRKDNDLDVAFASETAAAVRT